MHGGKIFVRNVRRATCARTRMDRTTACTARSGLGELHDRLPLQRGCHVRVPDPCGERARVDRIRLLAFQEKLERPASGLHGTGEEHCWRVLVGRVAIVGGPGPCADGLRAIVAPGIRRIYIGTRSVGVDLEERNTEVIGREVLPLVSRQPARV